MIRTVLLAVALMAAPLIASAQTARPAASADAADIARIAAFSSSQQQAVVEASDLLRVSIEGIDAAQRYSLTPSSRKAAKAWGEGWEAEMRGRIAKARTWKSRLPPFPRAELDRTLGGLPAMRAVHEAMPERVEGVIDLLIDFADRMIEPTRLAAEGDEKAQALVSVEMMRGLRLLLKAEHELLELAIAGTPDVHPQWALSKSMLANNEATGFLFDYFTSIMAAESVDQTALAANIRAKAAQARAAARETSTLATRMGGQIANISDPLVKPRLLAAFATYDESAAVEIEIADALDAFAATVEKGALVSGDPRTQTAPLQALSDRRLEVQARRVKLLTQ